MSDTEHIVKPSFETNKASLSTFENDLSFMRAERTKGVKLVKTDRYNSDSLSIASKYIVYMYGEIAMQVQFRSCHWVFTLHCIFSIFADL
jgi:hypothetical protein